MSSQTAEASVQQGINYLVQHQQENGSFTIVCNRSSQANTPLIAALGIHALMLDVVSGIPDQHILPVADRLAAYLLRAVSQLCKTKCTGLDSYVFFYSLAVLYEHDATSLAPDLIAAAIKYLVDNEQAPGGPYYTTLDSHDTQPDWLNNVAVSRFIHHLGGPFSKLTTFIDRGPTTYDRYYSAAWPLYFLSPSHRPKNTRQLQGSNPRAIMTSQQADGSWPVEYIHKDPDGKPGLLYGSTGLTTATMIACSRRAQPKAVTNSVPNYYAHLAAVAHADAATLNPLIGQTLQTRLSKLIRADTTYEIGPLAERIADALHTLHSPSPQVLQTLGLANLYNWVAYTIYDDFLDDEGDPQLLSAANIALRRAVILFSEAVPNPAFALQVAQTFNAIDVANAWELKHCRFAIQGNTIHVGNLPNYGSLYYLHNRSLSHGLPVIGTLLAAGLPINDPAIAAVRKSFRQYLIVRQLNDDLCDWRDDLQAGHISYVVAQVLRDANIQPGKRSLHSLRSKLEATFWEQSLPRIDSVIQQHAVQAKQLLTHSSLFRSDNFILILINNLANASAQLRTEYRQTNDFLQAFQAQNHY